MKEIILYSGKVALVDDKGYEALCKLKWYEHKSKDNIYARSSHKGDYILMHRFIMQPNKGLVIDHINHNTLDNRRANLRIVTQQTNSFNRKDRATQTSSYYGISKPKKGNLWVATIGSNLLGNIRVGSYDTELEAAKARDRFIVTIQDKTSPLNFTKEEVILDLAKRKIKN